MGRFVFGGIVTGGDVSVRKSLWRLFCILHPGIHEKNRLQFQLPTAVLQMLLKNEWPFRAIFVDQSPTKIVCSLPSALGLVAFPLTTEDATDTSIGHL